MELLSYSAPEGSLNGLSVNMIITQWNIDERLVETCDWGSY